MLLTPIKEDVSASRVETAFFKDFMSHFNESLIQVLGQVYTVVRVYLIHRRAAPFKR